jgi:hypothetical protein
VPTFVPAPEYVEGRALLSYGPSLGDMTRQTAVYVDKILKGAKAADLPVEQFTRYQLVINLKTAKALGLTIPPSLLAPGGSGGQVKGKGGRSAPRRAIASSAPGASCSPMRTDATGRGWR